MVFGMIEWHPNPEATYTVPSLLYNLPFLYCAVHYCMTHRQSVKRKPGSGYPDVCRRRVNVRSHIMLKHGFSRKWYDRSRTAGLHSPHIRLVPLFPFTTHLSYFTFLTTQWVVSSLLHSSPSRPVPPGGWMTYRISPERSPS